MSFFKSWKFSVVLGFFYLFVGIVFFFSRHNINGFLAEYRWLIWVALAAGSFYHAARRK